MHNQLETIIENNYYCWPLYIDRNGRKYYGRYVKSTLKQRITEEIERTTPNLCKVKTSGFGYTLPPFGFKNISSYSDNFTNNFTNKQTDTPNHTKKGVPSSLHLLLDIPIHARQVIAEVLPQISKTLFNKIGLMPLMFLPAHIVMDIGSGHSREMAIMAQTFGTGMGIIMSYAVGPAAGIVLPGMAITAALFAVAIGIVASITTTQIIYYLGNENF